MISWPAIISYEGDDELTFISDEREWEIDPDLNFHPYSEGDVVIDNIGSICKLSYSKKNKKVEIEATGKSTAVKEFEELIKKHMAYLNQCCVSKLNISTIQDNDGEEMSSIMKLLHDNGAKVDLPDYLKWTPLIHATSYKSVTAVKLLLEYGANPDFIPPEGVISARKICEDDEIIRLFI